MQLETIADNVDFTREDDGLTVINVSVGRNVKLSICDNSSLRIIGNIGRGCNIVKEGNGTLTIEGIVADDLKLVAYGQGSIIFTHQPSQFVISAIKNPCGTPIICAGTRLPTLDHGYSHHNLGVVAARRPEQHVPAPLVSAVKNTEKQYSKLTEDYIESYKKQKTIATRIAELELTEEETLLFTSFIEPIMMEYFDDTPVMYNERYFNLSTLLKSKIDPLTGVPLVFSDIQPARTLLNNLDDVINALQIKRDAANSTLDKRIC